MTTKPVRNVKIVMGPNGKVTLKRTRPFMARKKQNDADRLAKRWEAKKSPAGAGLPGLYPAKKS